MRNVIQMTYEPFFSKNLQKIAQRLGAAPPDSHSLRRLVAPPPEIPSVTRLSCTNLLSTSPNFDV